MTGPFGLLQPFADALKAGLKRWYRLEQACLPAGAHLDHDAGDGGLGGLPIYSPTADCTERVRHFAVADIHAGLLYLFRHIVAGVYGVIMAGWASNSKYPF